MYVSMPRPGAPPQDPQAFLAFFLFELLLRIRRSGSQLSPASRPRATEHRGIKRRRARAYMDFERRSPRSAY